MPKNIVFCADGTWDDPNNNSNVCQFYNALVNQPNTQLAFYDSGVGADCKPIWKVLGGSMGTGLFRKIKDGYSEIASQYQPEDKLFLFGFSRGAYMTRSLAGMIAICGLPTVGQTDPKCLDTAFEAYRNPSQRTMLIGELHSKFQMYDAKITLLGVWDTVGSLGIPAIFGGIDTCQYGFLDTSLRPNVLNAVQALSIDEERLQFQPTLWTSAPAPGQTMTQAWFSGVHCDVGGGYCCDPNGASLSRITLLWMAKHAAAFGAILKPQSALLTQAQTSTDCFATLHNSRTGAYRIFPRHIRNVVADSCISSSAKLRCANLTANYQPPNLHVISGQLAATYNIVNV